MKRRQFLGATAATLLLAGCGGSASNNVVVPVSSGDTTTSVASAASATPAVAVQTSQTDVIVADAAGTMFVTQPSSHKVSRLAADGSTVWSVGAWGSGVGQFDHPACHVLDGRGRLLVLDHGNARVVFLDPVSGQVLGTFGMPGTGLGQLHLARHLAVSSNRIYVSDQLNHRIAVFDLDGAPLPSIGTFGTGDGQLNVPRGVALDGAGHLFVSDRGNHRIVVFTTDGAYVRTLPAGVVSNPHGLAFDAAGQLWVADGSSGRLLVLSAQGALLQTLTPRLGGGSAAPQDVAVAGLRAFVYAQPNGPV